MTVNRSGIVLSWSANFSLPFEICKINFALLICQLIHWVSSHVVTSVNETPSATSINA
jgi:hypothetical protein